jgi:predicted transcriptional regulator
MDKTTVYLDPDDYRLLKRLAAEQHRPSAELVREAVAEYTKRHARPRIARSIGAFSSGRSDIGERAEELLEGMGTR